MTQIQFAGIVFDDEATVGFTISKWKGWWTPPPNRLDMNDRAQAHGSHRVARVYRGARVISVQGSYVGVTMADTYAALDAFAAIQGDGRPSLFWVVEPHEPKGCVVSLENLEPPEELFQPRFDFAFDVVAPDPLRYGATVLYTTGPPEQGGGLIFPIGSDGIPPSYGFAIVDLVAVDTGVAVE